MSTNNANPKWWQVYLTFPLLIALFVLDNRLKLSMRGHQIVQIGILILIYGIVHLWIKANATALSAMDQKQFHNTFTVIRIPPNQLPDTSGKRPIYQFANSEIKGILSDTFEMDYVDAEFSSVDAAPNEANKE
jgi:hypothetical protein